MDGSEFVTRIALSKFDAFALAKISASLIA